MDAGRRAHLTGLVEINGKHRLGVNHRVGDQHRWPCQPLIRRGERTHLMRMGAARLVCATLEVDAATGRSAGHLTATPGAYHLLGYWITLSRMEAAEIPWV
jgi:hypothetical protein